MIKFTVDFKPAGLEPHTCESVRPSEPEPAPEPGGETRHGGRVQATVDLLNFSNITLVNTCRSCVFIYVFFMKS